MYPSTSPYAPIPPAPVRRGWRHPALAIALLVILPPVGIVLAWLGHWSRRTKVIATVASAAWFVVVLVSPSGGTSQDDAKGSPAAVTTTSSPAPSPTPTPTPTVTTTPSPTPTPTPTPAPTTPRPSAAPVTATATAAPGDVRWASCAAAWRGGVPDTGMTSGVDRGYRSALDSDGDGVACSKDFPEQPATSDDDSTSGGGSGDDSGDDSVYYANCTAVRAAGAAPIHVGEPGYSRHLDRDGDGVACE